MSERATERDVKAEAAALRLREAMTGPNLVYYREMPEDVHRVLNAFERRLRAASTDAPSEERCTCPGGRDFGLVSDPDCPRHGRAPTDEAPEGSGLDEANIDGIIATLNQQAYCSAEAPYDTPPLSSDFLFNVVKLIERLRQPEPAREGESHA